MSWYDAVGAWARSLVRRGAAEARMDDEMRFHIEMETQKHIRAGLDPSEARRRALLSFGGVDAHKESMRQGRRVPVLESFAQDLRHASRSLRRSPGFTAVAVVTLALGVGAATAIFTVVDGVVLRPLPFPDGERLVRIWASKPERDLPFFSVSPLDFRDWKAATTRFAALGAFDRGRSVALTGLEAPAEVTMSPVTPEIFDVLGVSPLVGRALLASDVDAGHRAVVVGEGFGALYFGEASRALGRTLSLDGVAYQVVGVMPTRFAVPGTPAEVWAPLDLSGDSIRGARYLRVLGRVAAGETIPAATAELASMSARLAAQYPASNAGWTVNVVPLRDVVVGEEVRGALTILFGVVVLVLMIACANVANLLLTRAAVRGRELAVRAALGASRARIFRHAVAESLVLCAAAGVVGLVLAAWGIAVLRALQPASLPRLEEIALDGRVLAFTATVAVATAVLFGLVPILRIRGDVLHETLRNAARATWGRSATRARSALVVGQTALALTLMIGAGLLARSLTRLEAVRLGFEPAGVVTYQVNLPEGRYGAGEQSLRFFDALRERVAALPGVTDVAFGSSVPFGGANTGDLFLPEGMELVAGEQPPDADYRIVSASYFRTMGIPVLRGETLPVGPEAAQAVVISRTMAGRFWPEGSPVGRRLRLGDALYTIVGVVEDVRYQNLEAPEVRPMMYLSHRGDTPRALTLIARAGGDPERITSGVREAVRELDPAQPVPVARAMNELVGGAAAERRFNALLFGLFAALAATLAAVGIYGVLSYAVTQQTREIGVRAAFGASRADLRRRYLGHAAGLALAGAGLGLVASLALTRVLRSLLYRTSPTDPFTFVLMAALLVAVALLATWLPVRRAARVDAMVALRHD